MKKVILLFFVALFMITGCNKDEYYEREATQQELEANGGTYQHIDMKHLIGFENGKLYYFELGNSSSMSSCEYTINGEALTLTKRPFMEDILGGEAKYYNATIKFVHWPDKEGEQLLISGDNLPYNLTSGYYEPTSTMFN